METKVVMEDGITIGGKWIREHLEVINHAEAIRFVEEEVNQHEPLNERTLKMIHHLILKNNDDGNAGTYRSINVRIAGSQQEPPHFFQVANEMQDSCLYRWKWPDSEVFNELHSNGSRFPSRYRQSSDDAALNLLQSFGDGKH